MSKELKEYYNKECTPLECNHTEQELKDKIFKNGNMIVDR